MEIRHKHIGSKGVFFVEDDDMVQAELVYTMPSADKMIIEHTEVGESLKGQNVGFQLVQAAVEYARAHNIRIIPLCPFAHSVFERKPDFSDVLN